MFRAAALALALLPLGAEAVTYHFAFERYAAENLHIQPEGGAYVASVTPGQEYEPTNIAFGFTRDNLDGLTIDLTDILSISPDAWAIGSIEAGIVSFNGGSLSDWSVEAYEGDASRLRHSSAPLAFGWAADQTVNPELLPSAHYGESIFAPAIFQYALAPGRWVCLQGCDEPPVEVTQNPIPASLLFLLSGLAGLGLIRFRSP